jgi:anaerobic sulfite reductase subunit C
MKWTAEAEEAVRKVPFFVRKRVKARVESEAQAAGKSMVTLSEVKATQARYLSSMSSEIKGYQIETCFGPSGCPNRAAISEPLLERIEEFVQEADLLSFLKERVSGEIKFHHEFRITLADCPNACSQPQIKDIGIIGASLPAVTAEACSHCDACVEACRENAISTDSQFAGPQLDADRCLACGQCVAVCPTGALAQGCKGFRVQVGGKLGRHPRLALELPGIFRAEQVLGIVKDCLRVYKQRSRHGERLAEIFSDQDVADLAQRHRAAQSS